MRVIVCITTATPPYVESRRERCEKCGTDLWVSLAYEPEPGDVFQCGPCAMPDADVVIVPQYALREGEKYMERRRGKTQ